MGLQRTGGIGMQRERFSRRRDEPSLPKNTAASSSSNTPRARARQTDGDPAAAARNSESSTRSPANQADPFVENPAAADYPLPHGVEVAGLVELAGEGIGKKFGAPTAPMITSALLISSGTQLLKKTKPKTKQPSVKT